MMYKNILVPVEHSAADQTILTHIRQLAKMCSSRLTFIHVADGFGARYQKALNLSDSEEIHVDRAYLEQLKKEFSEEGFHVKTHLSKGDPIKEILRFAKAENCDLIAMATHGHGMFKDILLGSVADGVRHRTEIPVLMVKIPDAAAK